MPERENCNVQLGPAHIFPFPPSGQIVSVVASGVQRGYRGIPLYWPKNTHLGLLAISLFGLCVLAGEREKMCRTSCIQHRFLFVLCFRQETEHFFAPSCTTKGNGKWEKSGENFCPFQYMRWGRLQNYATTTRIETRPHERSGIGDCIPRYQISSPIQNPGSSFSFFLRPRPNFPLAA